MLGLGNILSKGGAVIQKFPNEYSFNFDGANDGLILPSSVAPTGNFTVSAWVYSTGQGTNSDNAFYYGAGLQIFLAINTTGNYVQTYIAGAGGGAKTANSTITQNQWHHIAVTWDGSNTKIYIDGDDKSVTGSGAGNPVTVTSHIGGKPGANVNQFKGYIDEVAIWHTNLDASTIAKLGSKPIDLTKYSASNLKLWIRAGDKVQPESTTSIARADYSAEFDGSDDIINCGSDSSLDNIWNSGGTLSAWIYPNSDGEGDDARIVEKRDDGNGFTFTVREESSGSCKLRLFKNYSTTNGVYTSGADVTIGAWNHVAVTYDTSGSGSSYRPTFYVNGVVSALSATTDSAGTADSDASEDFTIGGNKTPLDRCFDGKIANLSLHKTVFPANDIALMAKSRFTPTRDYMLKQVDFDGSDDYIDCGDLSYMDGVTKITITGWAKRLESDDRITFEKSTGVNDRVGLNLDVDGVLYANMGTGSAGRWAYASLSGTDWNHIAMVYDGTQGSNATKLNIYINGVKQSPTYPNDIPSTTPSTSGTFKIGRAVNNSGYSSTGSVVGVAVYSDAKDADFIYAQYAKGLFGDWSADSGLIGYWKMGNGTGDDYPTIVDQSSNSNNGTITNGTSDDIVENMVAGYDLGSFRGSEELGGNVVKNPLLLDHISAHGGNTEELLPNGYFKFTNPSGGGGSIYGVQFWFSTASHTILETIPVTGQTYKLSFNGYYDGGGSQPYWYLFDQSSGDVTFTPTTTPTDYEIYFTGSGATGRFQANTPTAGQSVYIKDFEIKPVLSSAVDDTKNAVIDVSNPVLGAEVNTLANALSPTNETDATTGLTSNGTISSVSSPTTSSNYSIKLETTENGDGISASSNFTVEIGKLYKFSITWKTESNDHSMKHLIGTTAGATSYLNLEGVSGSTEWVTSDYYFVTTHNILNFKFAEFTGDSDIVMYIDNISIKQVQGNVGTPTSMDATNFPYTSVLPDQSFLTGVNSNYGFGSFDGTNDIITTSAVNTDYKSFSVWVKPTSTISKTSGGEAIGNFGSNSYGIIWIGAWSGAIDNELITFYNGGAYRTLMQTTENKTFPNDSWTHIALVWDGSKYQMYFNGEPQTTVTYNNVDGEGVVTTTGLHTTLQSNNAITIGRGGASRSEFFDGDITGMAMWNKSLEASDILKIYDGGRHLNLLDDYSDNLITYQSFGALDSITGLADTSSTIYDRSGDANHGTVSGATIQSPPNAQPEGYDIESTTRTTTIP